MHKKILVFAVVAFILSTGISYGEELRQKKPFTPAPAALAPYIMTEKDMPGMTLTMQFPLSWKVAGEDGGEYRPSSTRQEWTYEDGFAIYINYYLLQSKDDIYNNIATHHAIKHGQWLDGSFSGGAVGDVSWVSNETTNCKFILVAHGKYLVMVENECSSRAEELKLEGTVLESIAQKVLDKL